MLKFTIEQLNELTDKEKLLIINFSLLVTYSSIENESLYNCYIENVDILQVAKDKLKISNDEADFLYHFFLENDHYWTMKIKI